MVLSGNLVEYLQEWIWDEGVTSFAAAYVHRCKCCHGCVVVHVNARLCAS